MSMLTPPGMGGKYKVSGNAYPRMRRRRSRGRRAVAGVAAVATLGVLSWGTLELVDVFRGDESSASAVPNPCPPGHRAASAAGQPLPATRTITVNVYNATTRGGLAKRTADELKKRGFRIGKVGNADAAHDKKVKESALLVGGASARPALTVLGAQLAGERVTTDRRRTATVDLVIGNAYRKLDPTTTVARALRTPSTPATGARTSTGHAPTSEQVAKHGAPGDKGARTPAGKPSASPSGCR